MASPVSCRTASVLFCLILFTSVHCTDTKPKKKKDIRDYNEADMARLLEEWEKFVVGSNRAIFMLRDGSYAWEIKDFLVAQDRFTIITVCIFLIRFVVGSNRAIFMLRDGSYAWEIKDFLIAQDRCEDVTVEGQVYPRKTAKKDAKGNEQNETKKKDKKAANRANKSKQEL
ncbi:LDLR chaperone MESD-like [Sinocyclocheilus anshuiensis]|uniref:LDLR chaperone MESD-like n=1 Tax=Sinocyclocheilus anshuiensis TaxID=1608454 RepID=UPI0007BA7697|nr:PREDICTED: LDLR chaperone MESD-like [Sinocyclocheilus anshuiensis]